MVTFRRLKVALGAPLRATRRRGHGIHSPFAFDFVRRVIAQPCRYYVYETMDSGGSRVRGKLMRLLFRLGLFFSPAEIVTEGDVDSRLMQALECGVLESGKTVDGRKILILAPGVMASQETVAEIASAGGVIVWLGMSAAARHRQQVGCQVVDVGHGMLFRGATTAVYVGYHKLPCQRFDVWI
ncbi:MAG: hypothetical protein K2M94_02130 [Paramuribaculum sp.]|nr:hypothetical protein [Paramuribaculum sp.]